MSLDQANVGSLSRLSYAKETTVGTPVNPTTKLLPVKSADFSSNPNYQELPVMTGEGDAVHFLVPGQEATTGTASYPLLPDVGNEFLAAAIGNESATTGVVDTGSPLATTLAAASSAGATTVSLTATATANDILQIDSAANGAEVRKVVSITGAGPYVATLDQALARAHASGATVTKVLAPFTHKITQSLQVSTFTIETYQGGVGSVSALQYAGSVVSKLKFTADNKTAPEASVDFMCLSETLLGSGSISDPAASTGQPITWDQNTPLFGTAGQSDGGTFVANTDLESVEIDIDNTAKSDYTQSGKLSPTRIAPTAKKITGKATFYYLDDATFYTPFKAKTATAFQYKSLNAAGYGAVWTFPQTVWAQYKRPFKFADFITQELTFTAKYDTTLGATAQLSLITADYLPF